MTIKLATLLLLGAAAESHTLLTQTEAVFMEYMAKFGKSYPSEREFAFRLGIFQHTLQLIEQVNAEQTTHRAGINKFSDLTH